MRCEEYFDKKLSSFQFNHSWIPHKIWSWNIQSFLVSSCHSGSDWVRSFENKIIQPGSSGWFWLISYSWQELQLICLAQIKIGGDFWGSSQLSNFSRKCFKFYWFWLLFNFGNFLWIPNIAILKNYFPTLHSLLWQINKVFYLSGFQRNIDKK